MSLNLIASAASSVAHFGSPIDPIAHESPAMIGHSLDAVALNPQPLPPRELGLASLHNRFDAVALNPQPLPPREVLLGSVLRSVNAVALNPQPLPPHEGNLRSILRSLDAVALNPQPLPPRETLSLAARIGVVADEFCGTVPRRLPSPPAPR
jgi:hypothetical protein